MARHDAAAVVTSPAVSPSHHGRLASRLIRFLPNTSRHAITMRRRLPSRDVAVYATLFEVDGRRHAHRQARIAMRHAEFAATSATDVAAAASVISNRAVCQNRGGAIPRRRDIPDSELPGAPRQAIPRAADVAAAPFILPRR